MKIYRNILLFSLFTLSSYLQSQVKISETNQLFAEKLIEDHKKDASAIKSSIIEFSFELNSDNKPTLIQYEENEIISLRLNHQIHLPYYYDQYSEISSFKCLNNKGKKTYIEPICGNLQIDNIFHHDVKFCSYPLNFTSIGEVKTLILTKEVTDIKYFTKFFLNAVYPISNRKVIIKIPDWLELEIKEYHFDNFNITKNTKQLPEGITEISYTIENIDGIKEENFSKGAAFTQPHLLFLFKRYKYEGQSHNIISSLDDLYKWYHSLVKDEDSNSEYIKNFTTSLTSNENDIINKIRKVYYWVQDNVRYLAFEEGIAGYKPEKAEEVLKKKYGDCKGMANLMKSMLVSIGCDARLTWLGTNNVIYDYTTPSLAADNHMICTVFLNGKKLYLDPTEKYSSIDNISERIQGRQVLIENDENYILESIPSFDYTNNIYHKKLNLSLKDDKLTGKIEYTFKGEKKVAVLSIYNSTNTSDKEMIIKEILSGDKNIQLQDLIYTNLDNRDSTLHINANVSISNNISKFNNEWFISLNPFGDIFEFPNINDRKNDIHFLEKIFYKTDISLEIPSSYKIEYVPENYILSNEWFECSFHYKKVGNNMIYSETIKIPRGYIPKEMMDEWKSFLTKLRLYNNEQIILATQ